MRGRPTPTNRRKKKSSLTFPLLLNLAFFILGCVFCSTWALHNHTTKEYDTSTIYSEPISKDIYTATNNSERESKVVQLKQDDENIESTPSKAKESSNLTPPQTSSADSNLQQQQIPSGLTNIRVLVAIASYNFAQLPHLEEVLDSYHDLCITGAIVHLYIHTTVPYPVALIDLLNSRLSCDNMEIKIVIKSPGVRLNLVDFHRTLFYDKIDDYDLFLYSEDDIRVTPKTISAYLQETKRIEEIVGKSPAEDYNVGIVRYEYNYPDNLIIDDKTRHATENVTRVYWEHLWKPIIGKVLEEVPQEPLKHDYVHMMNHHQGMFMATRDLLKAWKERPGCNFDVIRQRPGLKNNPNQPAEGTQRVWMSSNMLHGKKHCNVQQVLPMNTFGQLNVLHLPNKNYRRVGKQGRIGGSDSSIKNDFGTGKEKFEGPSDLLTTAMQVHLEMRKAYPPSIEKGGKKYTGIQMIDEVDPQRHFKGKREYMKFLDKRMRAYEDYARSGVMSEKDYQSWQWQEKW